MVLSRRRRGTVRFSEPSRQALKTANREAHRLGHPAVGTGHLLWALLRIEDCAASGLLRRIGVEAMNSLPSLDSLEHDLATEELVGTPVSPPDGAIDELRIDALVRSGRVVRLVQDPNRL